MHSDITKAINDVKQYISINNLKNLFILIDMLDDIQYNSKIDFELCRQIISDMHLYLFQKRMNHLSDDRYYVCGCVESIINTYKNTNDDTLECMNFEVSHLLKLNILT